MEIIITNDDGISAPGIRALFNAIEGYKLIIAPKDHHSGCGHKVTTDTPFQVTKISEKEIAVHGTPADCTRLAISHFAPEASWVISGINAGGNLGVDLYISGTAAAAREASILGKKAIAISQRVKDGKPIDWEKSTFLAKKVFLELFEKDLPSRYFWNVNLPQTFEGDKDPRLVYCEPSTDPLHIKYNIEGNTFHYAGEYSKRILSTGRDVDICFSGDIAISLVKV